MYLFTASGTDEYDPCHESEKLSARYSGALIGWPVNVKRCRQTASPLWRALHQSRCHSGRWETQRRWSSVCAHFVKGCFWRVISISRHDTENPIVKSRCRPRSRP